MIDIHAHIIPGVDDGSRDMGTSVLMAEIAAESGVSAIIATPHCNQRGVCENFVSDRLLARMDSFRNELEKENIDIDIGYGMEIYCTSDVPKLLKEKKLLTLNGSRYALVEFNFGMDTSRMERLLYSVMDNGFVPIIAHPERYYQLQGQLEIVADWMNEGIGIQLNKGSLFGHFGRDAHDFAHAMLRYGLVTCIASDAHGSDSRTTDMTEIYDFLLTEFSPIEAERLLTDNPRRIYYDEPLISGDDILLY